MRIALLAGVAVMAASASSLMAAATVHAADVPTRRYAPVAPAPVVPIFAWTGVYVGANAGAAFGNDREIFVPGVGTVGSGGGDAGFTGGGQVGYNHQIGALVLGVETDLQYADLRGNNGLNGGVFVPGFVPFFDRGIEWFGTARGRVGYALDRALLYGTGGFAYGGGDSNGCAGAGVVAACGNNDTRGGWTAGAGLEYAFTNNWTAKVEGLYVNLERNNNIAGTLNGVPVVGTGNRNEDFGVVRAGINYKFW